MDTEYLKTHLSACLPLSLAEIAELRPKDPIEYLSQSLYKYVDNVKYRKNEKDMALQMQKEMEIYIAQQEQRSKLEEERAHIRKRLREEEELLKAERAREAERLSAGQNLPTLLEYAESPAHIDEEQTSGNAGQTVDEGEEGVDQVDMEQGQAEQLNLEGADPTVEGGPTP